MFSTMSKAADIVSGRDMLSPHLAADLEDKKTIFCSPLTNDADLSKFGGNDQPFILKGSENDYIGSWLIGCSSSCHFSKPLVQVR